jgi:hypothetical protein
MRKEMNTTREWEDFSRRGMRGSVKETEPMTLVLNVLVNKLKVVLAWGEIPAKIAALLTSTLRLSISSII